MTVFYKNETGNEISWLMHFSVQTHRVKKNRGSFAAARHNDSGGKLNDGCCLLCVFG